MAMVRVRHDLMYHRHMFSKSLIFLTGWIVVGCAILIAACCIVGFWQPSTELAYACAANFHRETICLTDADRGLVIRLNPRLPRTNNGITKISWSPDGSRLAFSGGMNGVSGLFITDARTFDYSLLVKDAINPAWSPDGQHITFSLSNYDDHSTDLYTTDPDGNINLLRDSDENIYNPAWSPDGTRIAFQEIDAQWHSVIYVMNTDGSDLHPVTDAESIYFDPVWSPDGNQLALHEGRSQDLVVLDLDDGEIHLVTPILDQIIPDTYGNELYGYKGSPSWSPNGARIAFDSDSTRGFWQPQGWWIYIMNADGSHAYVIDHGSRPAWRPPRSGF